MEKHFRHVKITKPTMVNPSMVIGQPEPVH